MISDKLAAPAWRGVYINLDTATARRAALEDGLRRHGLEAGYERLRAVTVKDVPSGDVADACFMSHTLALRAAADASMPIHIVEDDVVFTPYLRPAVERIVERKLLDRVDVIFFDMWLDPDLALLRTLEGAFRQEIAARKGNLPDLKLLDMARMRVASAASYLVGPRGARKVARLLDEEIRRGPRFAVDTCLDRLVRGGRVTAALAFPFLTGIDPATGSESSIQNLPAEQMRLLALLRGAFVADVDIDATILPEMHRLAATGRYQGLGEICRLFEGRRR